MPSILMMVLQIPEAWSRSAPIQSIVNWKNFTGDISTEQLLILPISGALSYSIKTTKQIIRNTAKCSTDNTLSLKERYDNTIK